MSFKKKVLIGVSEVGVIACAIIIANLLQDYGFIPKLTGGTALGALILAAVIAIGAIALRNWQEKQK